MSIKIGGTNGISDNSNINSNNILCILFCKTYNSKRQFIKTNQMGIPEEKTTLITDGIYQWSRNPAFVGFDLLYLSICLMFFNIPLVLVSVWAAVMLHLQILQEEKHMSHMFGNEYETYKKHTLRYFGKR